APRLASVADAGPDESAPFERFPRHFALSSIASDRYNSHTAIDVAEESAPVSADRSARDRFEANRDGVVQTAVVRLRGSESPNAARDCREFLVSALIGLTTGRGMDTIVASDEWRSTLDCFRCATISEAIMSSILSLTMVLGVCGLAGAADDKVV